MTPNQFPSRRSLVVAVVTTFALLGTGYALRTTHTQDAPAPPVPALTVSLTQPATEQWPVTLAANGSIHAWQEAAIGAELAGLRLVEVLAQVGDRVQRGQLLARLSDETLRAELDATRASVAEAEAALREAESGAERAHRLAAGDFISAQQVERFSTAAASARARVATLAARAQADALRLAQTRILAPDAGVISARLVGVGSVVAPGQEIYRLIRQQRLEWRAEVAASDLALLRPGVAVRVTPAGSQTEVAGTVRVVAPSVDAATRNGLVYVDLIAPGDARAGMFARGEFALGRSASLSLPQAAVVLRDGFGYVMSVDADGRARAHKVGVGRRRDGRIEITHGLNAHTAVVEQGAGFLSDGDSVKVVRAVPATLAPGAAELQQPPTAQPGGTALAQR